MCLNTEQMGEYKTRHKNNVSKFPKMREKEMMLYFVTTFKFVICNNPLHGTTFYIWSI